MKFKLINASTHPLAPLLAEIRRLKVNEDQLEVSELPDEYTAKAADWLADQVNTLFNGEATVSVAIPEDQQDLFRPYTYIFTRLT